MPKQIDIVAGYIHDDICGDMVNYAAEVQEETDSEIRDVLWVPGSLEAPLAAEQIILHRRPNAIVVFGVQQAGETKHGEVIAQQVTRALLNLQLQYEMPMAVSIIGPGATLDHAAEKARYVARKAMRAAAYMVDLMAYLRGEMGEHPPIPSSD